VSKSHVRSLRSSDSEFWTNRTPEKPDDRMCWVDSEAQWAGVGWRNVADVEMQLRWLEWCDRRGTEVLVHANNGTSWGRAWILHLVMHVMLSAVLPSYVGARLSLHQSDVQTRGNSKLITRVITFQVTQLLSPRYVKLFYTCITADINRQQISTVCEINRQADRLAVAITGFAKSALCALRGKHNIAQPHLYI